MKLEGTRRLEHIASVSMRPSRAVQERLKDRSQTESVSLERGSEAELNQPARDQKEKERVNLLSSKSQNENILGLD